MKVIVDSKIPYIREAITALADEVVFAAGADFTPDLVRDADALIVRTRTRCNEALLKGSRVQFIATATIGFDHIDTTYCRKAGIAWSNAPGCNAASVAQYVESALLLLQKEKGLDLEQMTLGVVGVGHVGTKVAAMAEALGMKVLRNDPPRQQAEGDNGFCPLHELAERCDILTFHTPLIREGEFRTFHLVESNFINSLKRKPILINTSRGEVVNTSALKEGLADGQLSQAIIDVWENEPHIDLELLQEVYIGTPHIAGYSADGKANATRQALDTFCHHFHLPQEYTILPPEPPCKEMQADTLSDALLQIYNPHTDSRALKEHPETFEQLRGDYPLRREKGAYLFHYN